MNLAATTRRPDRTARPLAALLVAFVTLASAAGAAGCDWPFVQPSRGTYGRAEFAYSDGILGCIFGCDADGPMAERARVHLLVLNADELPPFTVSSDDPELATFAYDPQQSESTIVIETYGAGWVTLVLTDLEGELVDEFPMRVEAVREIAVRSPGYDDALTIFEGGEVSLHLELRDERGEALHGVGGVDYEFVGDVGAAPVDLGDALAQAIVSALVGTNDEYVQILAGEPTRGAVWATAPSGAVLSVPVNVVDETAVARLDVSCPAEPVSLEEKGDTSSCSAAAFTASDEYVYDVLCDWSIANDPADAIAVDYTLRNTVDLRASGPGSAIVTCTVGAVSASAPIAFE